jgi:hypothetical protein
MDARRVDPAALLLAVIVVGLQPITENGDWEPINTVISAVVLGVALCFLWPPRDTSMRNIVGFAIGIAFILGVGLAWPVQAIWGADADAATYWGLGSAAAAAAVAVLQLAIVRWARRLPTAVTAATSEENRF